jgi:RimJ/RimL family protein N-acetyltransferase
VLADAAAGRFPPPDGVVEVLGAPLGPVDAVVGFTAHHLVAADVDPDWVGAAFAVDDLGAPMRAEFLARLGERLGTTPGMLDVVLVAFGDKRRSELVPDGEGGRLAHPRVARARRYRRDVRCFEDRRGGLLTLGHGLTGRVEVSIEVDEKDRGRGRGLALARAALGIVHPGEAVFAQVSPGNVASLRCFLAAGYRPVGAEVLFLRTARRRLDNWPAATALEGPRVALEPLTVSHAEEMAPLLDDPELYGFIGGQPLTIEELRHRYQRQATGRSADGNQRWCNWIVRRRHDARAVGTVQATIAGDGHDLTAEVAWVIARGYQRNGYAREAAQVMIEWLLDRGADSVVAHIHPQHHASMAVARALGLTATTTVFDGEIRWEM